MEGGAGVLPNGTVPQLPVWPRGAERLPRGANNALSDSTAGGWCRASGGILWWEKHRKRGGNRVSRWTFAWGEKSSDSEPWFVG